MTCVHLQQLYRLCQEHDLKLGGADLIHIVCNQCGEQEVCPATLTDEYDAKEAERHAHEGEQAAGGSPGKAGG
jgi:hypothetical protein